MAEVIMPRMGDAMDEGKIVQWLKQVGDTVKADDAIAEIETDKSNVEVSADSDGIIQSLAYQVGDSVPVGTVIAVIGSGSVAPAPQAAPAPVVKPAPEAAPPAAPEPTPVPASAPAAKSNGSTPAPAAAPAAPEAAPAVAGTGKDFKPYDSFVGQFPENLGGSASLIGAPIVIEGQAQTSNERVKATPVARAMAQANNIDLAALRGTGPDGAVGKADVAAALSGGAKQTETVPVVPPAIPTAAAVPAPSVPAPVIAEGDEVQEYNAMRRTIAKRLTESKQTIPHFYVTAEIDIEAMFALREQVNASASETSVKISVNDFLVKAVAVAIGENPVVNSQFLDNKRIIKKAINIGIAVSIDDGLIVPVVKGCETKSIRAIAKEARPLIEKARAGKLKPEDYTGGTFTISNMGSLTPDVENFAAIINPGEAAILAVSSIRTVPAVVGDAIVPRKRMKVTLCADHRVMDGSAGALFLQSLKRAIENPLQILA